MVLFLEAFSCLRYLISDWFAPSLCESLLPPEIEALKTRPLLFSLRLKSMLAFRLYPLLLEWLLELLVFTVSLLSSSIISSL
ncbi:hypothetical protein EVA_08812 [gut metagenome]|uniref:Uncharacterized protein n=1 Tax=gut metagenome TaxID=749906 RepID=J9G8C0_9ZZZZ